MQRLQEKRKRAANFSEEEKLRFLRILQEKGKLIISKVTSHDSRTNKQKEETWEIICQDLNTNGFGLRNVSTLKKLWQKLKSDAKTYKSVAGQHVSGTGGGPPINLDNPVLELVVEMTGRGSTGISGVRDCDSETVPVCVPAEIYSEEGDETRPLTAILQSRPPPIPPAAAAQVPLFEPSIVLDKHIQTVEVEVPTYTENTEKISGVSAQQIEMCSTPIYNRKPKNLKRRRPQLDNTLNERSEPSRAQMNHSNSFASERLRSERAKNELIKLKIEQETELHKLRMENEQRLHLLNEKILEKILKKVEDGDQLDADIIQVAFGSTAEKENNLH